MCKCKPDYEADYCVDCSPIFIDRKTYNAAMAENAELKAKLAEYERQVGAGEWIRLDVAREFSLLMWRFGRGLIVQPKDIKQFAAERATIQ